MISAEISEDVVAQSGQSAIVLTPNLDVTHLSAPVNCRLHIFAPAFDPFDRLAKLDRYPAEQSFFCIDVELGAKAAANFRRNHAQLVLCDANHQGELGAKQVRDLG